MKSNRSPELVLLLMACRLELQSDKKNQLINFLSANSIDWNRVYRQADRHRLIPFLYRILQQIEIVPPAFIDLLRKSCQTATIDSMIKLQQYRSVDTLLSTNSIDHIAFKGLYLSEYCYPDTSLRISGDIDILVSKDDAMSTIRLLQNNGYRLNKKHTLYVEDGEEKVLNDLYEVSLFKTLFNDNALDIDLHWNIICFNKDFATFDLRYIRSFSEYQTEVQVILLIAHHGVTNIWQKIYYINDLYFLVKDKEIDWEWLMEKMRGYGMERILLAGLGWCQQIWDLRLPQTIQQLVRSKDVEELVFEYEKNWEADTPQEFSPLVFSQFRYFSKAQSQLSKKAKIYTTFCTSRVFRASTFKVGKKIIYVPKEFGLITVFIRAVRSFMAFFTYPKSV